MKNLIMVAVAVCFAVFAVNANAATLTVAHTDLTLAGGVSATYNYVSDEEDEDHFSLDSALIHVFKDPTMDSPLGGHLAYAGYDVKMVTGQEVEPTIHGENYRPWLAYASYMPVENLTVDLGLLWHKFGEAPVAILNPHVTRSVAFIAQPVAFNGARVSYDAGMAKFYVGYNDGTAVDDLTGGALPGILSFGEQADSEHAFEVGGCIKLADMVKVAVNYFDYDEGYDTINASIGVDIEKFHAKLEANFVSADNDNTVILYRPGEPVDDNDAVTCALYLSHKCTDNFKVPLRIEYVDDNDSGIYLGYDGWNVTLSPTYMPTKNSFIKLEGVYARDDNDVFADDEGVGLQEDSRYAVIAEFGFLF